MYYSNNTFVILAASQTRFVKDKSVSKICIRNKILLETQVKSIKDFCPDARIILVTGFDRCSHDDCEIVFNNKHQTNYQSESLNLAINGLRDTNLWVIHGDIYFTKTSLRVMRMDSYCVNADRQNIKAMKVGLRSENNQLIAMEYGLIDKWGQIFYVPNCKLKEFQTVAGSMRSAFIYDIVNKIAEKSPIYIFRDHRSIIKEMEESI